MISGNGDSGELRDVASAAIHRVFVLSPRPGPRAVRLRQPLEAQSLQTGWVQVSQSRAVAGSVVDGHSVNGAINGVSANRVSSTARRRA